MKYWSSLRALPPLIVVVVAMACSGAGEDVLAPRRASVPPLRWESCPDNTEPMPGGWCQDEFALIDANISGIIGDASCDLMGNKLRSWLYAGRILKATDLSPNTGAITHYYPESTFTTRHEHTDLNKNWFESGLRLSQIIRHEYGHVHCNCENENYIINTYEPSCSENGGPGAGVPEPAPPMQ